MKKVLTRVEWNDPATKRWASIQRLNTQWFLWSTGRNLAISASGYRRRYADAERICRRFIKQGIAPPSE